MSKLSSPPVVSFGSLIPHEYRSAVPACTPLLVSVTEELYVLPFTFWYGALAPATTFDRPRGASSHGTRSW